MNHFNFSLQQLAHFVQGELICFGDDQITIHALKSLTTAQADHISFVNQAKYLAEAKLSKAGVLLVSASMVDELKQQCHLIVVPDPYLAFAQLTHVFEIKSDLKGIDPTAQIDPTAEIAEEVSIGAHVVIGARVKIGRGSMIKSHSVIEARCVIGQQAFIEHHVVIQGQAQLGDRVRIHSNTVIGGEGFGFAPYQGKWHRIAQIGSVVIGHDVRIGSNCSIDRGALDNTIIEDNVIIDNLVQIAHNVQVGTGTAIAAKCGIAGSAKIGKNCILAGACGVVGHLEITDGVTLTGMTMVTSSIREPGTYSSGSSAMPNGQWKRSVIRLRQLADVPLTQMVKRLEDMHSRIESLEQLEKPANEHDD